jgi:methylated-DNA-[protein]-cysteine S-methyltransferase
MMVPTGLHLTAVDAPWGPIHLAVTPRGVAALEVMTPPDLFAERLGRRFPGPVERSSSDLLDRAVAAVEAFLAGRPAALSELPIELARGTSPWDRAVFDGVRRVPWGDVTSYGRLARSIGRPGAARAAGGAVGRNPIGLLIPCHRVIAGDGSIGGYGGDWYGSREQLLDVKRELLALEGVALPVRFPPA